MSLIVNSKNTAADNNGLNLSLNKPQSAKAERKMAAASTASSKCSKSNGHSIDAILGIRAAAAAQAAHQANLANNHHLFTNNSIHHSTGKIYLTILKSWVHPIPKLESHIKHCQTLYHDVIRNTFWRCYSSVK